MAVAGSAVTAMERKAAAPPDAKDVAIFLKQANQGGVARVACVLASGFAERGVSTEVVLARSGGAAERLLTPGVSVALLTDRKSRGRGSTAAPKAVATVTTLASYIRRRKPKVLISPGNHNHVTVTASHVLAGAAGRTHLVVKMTNPILKDRHGPLKRWYRMRLYRWIFSRASTVLVLSRKRAEQIAAAYPEVASKLRFVHNPYVTAAMSGALSPDTAGAGQEAGPVVLAVGRLVEQKNYALLIRAMAQMAKSRWRLVILGTGPQEQRLKTLAEELGIADRVTFEGFVADPAPYFKQARVLCLSSNYEDLPAVILEALACGCPVVATACSEAVVAVLDEAGYGAIVPPGDAAAFARAVTGFLERPPARRVVPQALAYSVENGIKEHLSAVRPWLKAP